MLYNDAFDPNDQVTAEEQIAAYLFDEADGFEGSEEDAANAGREILRMVLEKFRPDLFE